MTLNNEVYGQVMLDVSFPTDETNETMALLKENYRLSPIMQRKVVLLFEDSNGHTNELKVHNWDLILDRFFGEGE